MPGPARDFAGKKVKTKRLQISLPEPVVDRLDDYWLKNKAKIDNRAHAVRTLMRLALEQTGQASLVEAVLSKSDIDAETRDIHLDIDQGLFEAVRSYYEQKTELKSMSAAYRELIHNGLLARNPI